MLRIGVVSLLLLALTACSGGGMSAAAPPHGAIDSVESTQTSSVREVESGASVALEPAYVSSAADLLYVGNVGNNSITVYRHDASGNAAPIKVIAGSNTGIDAPGQLAEDANGNLYVTNAGRSAAPGVLIFAHGANGNVSPIRRIKVAPGFTQVEAATVDATTGKIFIAEDAGNVFTGPISLFRYAPNPGMHASPLAVGNISFPALQFASDSTGKNLIEAHTSNSPSGVGYGIDTLPKQFPNNTNVNAIYSTSYSYATGLADDPSTKTYLAMERGSGIERFAENTVGSGGGEGGVTYRPAILSTITREVCGSQIALGYLRNIYVTHSVSDGGCPKDAVYVYRHDASGDVAPLRILSGAATKLNQPYGIYEGQ